MVTVKISIKKHLEEYMRGKFNDCREGVITLPDKTDLYHTLFDLTSKRRPPALWSKERWK